MLVVDCSFLSQKITGTQKFASEICKALKKQDDSIVFVSHPNILQKELAEKLNVKIIGHKSYKLFRFLRLPGGLLWEQLVLPFYVNKHYNGAKLLSLVNIAPIFYKNNIFALHDVAFKRYPEFFKTLFLMVYNTIIPIALKRAKKVLTVSEFSKKEIVKFFTVDESKIDIVYNAVLNQKKETNKDRTEKYILAVGSIEPRKNISRLIEAMAELNGIKLIIVGGQNSKVFNGNIDKQSNINIKFTGYVKDSELEKLYANATAFIYPSIYEGFGIPPLEAQSFGIPTIVSDIEVFHEVYEDSVYYVDPYDISSIQSGIKKVMDDKQLQLLLIKRGYENVKKYSWEKSAKKILGIV